ncbi:MAG: MarR family transcriptional regulator [Planctomycetes bacterium]|nr:MarR family transcriptional regulator [Planctomycetota bacterium]
MNAEPQLASTDTAVIDLLRRHSAMTVSQFVEELRVTATAVRQRLTRLMAQGLIERRLVKAVRGRPSHEYALTDEGRRQAGTNFPDLALVLWNEIREIEDPQVRRGLLQRIAHRMADQYADDVCGDTVSERMEKLAELYRGRRIPLSVEYAEQGDKETRDDAADKPTLPVLHALACPYPELAERDRGVCAMERMMFAELLDTDLRLTQCRLDGGDCCTFQ